MTRRHSISRRQFVAGTMAAATAAGAVSSAPAAADEPVAAHVAPGDAPGGDGETAPGEATFNGMPCGFLGKAKISRLMLGGNLIGGYMHSRDLRYVNQLFRAYATEEKILATLRIAEENGINTVFETGADFVNKYNDRFQGRMQVIP
ncbi:MAG: twin-arginine translocation signal domain-containing protein, partial [Planctomycetes bacterium]|nr:twin-arginine translocation signal domain-containing protein [Planctomycetota bacterium]